MPSPSASRIRIFLPLVLAMIFAVAPSSSHAQTASEPAPAEPSARALVHILDYLGQDYAYAVSEGKVVNEAEYEEMRDFGRTAGLMLTSLIEHEVIPGDAALTEMSEGLKALIEAKAEPEAVAERARALREAVIRHSGLLVAPLTWPSVADGGRAYAAACASCHGVAGAGDGPLADGLDPRPTNFVEGERVASLSPFQVYNTIRMGVEGTAMPAHPRLSDGEVWDLAFFVKSLQAAQAHPAAANPAAEVLDAVTLEEVATSNDAELTLMLEARGVPAPAEAMAALRTAAPPALPGGTLAVARDYLDEAFAAYTSDQPDEARRLAVLAYLEGVEPIEPALRADDPGLTAELEGGMMAVRSAIDHREDAGTVRQAVDEAQALLLRASDTLDRREHSSWFSFIMAASILLREGLEAFLVILAILGVLRAVKNRKAARWVHAGWMLAIGLGVLGWFFSDLLIQLGAARRELMEGGIALFAVVVLLYVGFWLHSKTEIHKWKEFIDVRVKHALNGGNLFGLAAISFFAVFREAFESVLFLSALTIEEGTRSKMAIASGAILAIVLVLVLAAVLLRYSTRLPIRSLFRYSSFVMGVLSVILIGKGIHALQETGLLSITRTPFSWRFDLLGFYPTLETVLAQAVIVGLVALLWYAPALRARAVEA